jgi:hypothetical protein
MAATLVTGFDIEAIRKMEFVFIGTVRARSWNPMACRKASLPAFAIAMTVAGHQAVRRRERLEALLAADLSQCQFSAALGQNRTYAPQPSRRVAVIDPSVLEITM